MDPASLAAFGVLLGFLRDAGLLGGAVVIIFMLATRRAYTKAAHDDAMAAKDEVIRIERERRADALRQRDEWRKLSEGTAARVDGLTRSVDVLADSVAKSIAKP